MEAVAAPEERIPGTTDGREVEIESALRLPVLYHRRSLLIHQRHRHCCRLLFLYSIRDAFLQANHRCLPAADRDHSPDSIDSWGAPSFRSRPGVSEPVTDDDADVIGDEILLRINLIVFLEQRIAEIGEFWAFMLLRFWGCFRHISVFDLYDLGCFAGGGVEESQLGKGER